MPSQQGPRRRLGSIAPSSIEHTPGHRHRIRGLYELQAKREPRASQGFEQVNDGHDNGQVATHRRRHAILRTHDSLTDRSNPRRILLILLKVIQVQNGLLPPTADTDALYP